MAHADELSGDDWSSLGSADIVILGEVHDNPYHHANQAAAVAALQPTALVFEQLTPELAARITPELIEDAALMETVLEWAARGWPDFEMYHPIFAAAPDAAYFGGGAPPEDVRRAVSEGAAPVFGEAAALFQLDRPYAADVQARLETIQHDAHCGALPAEMLPGMVEAQRLRDAALARAAIAAHAEASARGGGPVVVITGNGHAGNELAVPALLRSQPMELAVISVGQFEDAAPDAPDFDHWTVTEAVDRDDPCAVFRQ